MPEFRTLDDFDVSGKRVLLRADLNVPMKDGVVTDATRIDRLVPTLRELAEKGAKTVIVSHFGRPKGKSVPEMSLRPVVEVLSEALDGRSVAFAEDCVGPSASAAVSSLEAGGFVLLENLRFHPQEEANDPEFAKELAANGDIYVNDAFSCAHRAHASTEAVARLLPAAAGRLMEEEISALAKALENPQRPAAAFVGGAKISTKLEMLGNLSAKVDLMAIGGGMANTFLNALGVGVGRSLCEHDMADTARVILETAENSACEVVLPVDAVVAPEAKPGVSVQIVDINEVPDDAMILDIGPKTAALLIKRMERCATLLWNGPFGVFEIEPFDSGTLVVARTAARLTKAGKLLSIAGGGDTVAALAHADAGRDFTYVSAAGGAFLEWIEGKTLPGVAALTS